MHHEADGEALADLDVALEHKRVVVAEVKRGNGHHLWNGAEVEDALCAQA